MPKPLAGPESQRLCGPWIQPWPRAQRDVRFPGGARRRYQSADKLATELDLNSAANIALFDDWFEQENGDHGKH